jgi:uncharacterized Tic20 family protein
LKDYVDLDEGRIFRIITYHFSYFYSFAFPIGPFATPFWILPPFFQWWQSKYENKNIKIQVLSAILNFQNW